MPTRRREKSEANPPAHTTIRLSYASRERLLRLMDRAEQIHRAQQELGLMMYTYRRPSADEFVEICLVEMELIFQREENRLGRIRQKQEATKLAEGGEQQ